MTKLNYLDDTYLFESEANCGCSGTHVNTASEIGKITIRKIKSNQGKTKIAYSVV